jgi:transposase
MEELVQQDPYRVPVQYLRCFRGIDSLSALTLVVEAMEFKRFGTARKFMSYTGAVSSENSSANRVRRGSITKAGNAHLRRILVEAAWSYQHPHGESRVLAERRKECPREVVYLARKAQNRLSRMLRRIMTRLTLFGVFLLSVFGACTVRGQDNCLVGHT